MSLASSENGTEAEDLEEPYRELYELLDDGASAITYDSDAEKKVKKRKGIKPAKSPKSPYLSNTNLYTKKAPVWRSLKGTGTMHTENPMTKVPRQLWLASLKQGNGLTQPLKSDVDIGQAWVNSSSSTPEYLKEALGMKKPKYSRSSSNGYIPGTPDYKEKEEMYDQILDLKKMLQAQKSESDILKTKLRRLEEENSRKDRQIEQLLDPARSSEFARSFVEKRSDSSLIVNNLKQKILKLEKQCKEKDNALNKLQTELKTTSLEEMKIAMETYYVEIQRLQVLLAKAEATARKSPPESPKQQKAMNSAIIRLSKKVKELQDENQSLKTDLDRAMAPSPTSTTTKGYGDWSKQRLVRKISELEKKLEKLQNSSKTEPEKSSRAGGPSTSEQADGSSHAKPDLQEECERLKILVKKIKEDRAALQTLLGTKESEIKKLQQEKSDLDRQLQRNKDRHDEREEIQRLNQKIKKLTAELEDEKRDKESISEAMKKVQNQSQDSRPNSARNSSSSTRRPSSEGRRESQQKQEAAQVIQKNWKLYKSKKDRQNLEEVAVLLQAALRGHLAREKMISTTASPRSKSPRTSLAQQDLLRSNSSQDFTREEDDAVTLLQSSFRAHLARAKMLGQSVHETRGRESPGIKIQRENTMSLASKKSPRKDVRHSFDQSSDDVSDECIEEVPSAEEEAEVAVMKRPGSRNRSLSQTPAVSRRNTHSVEEPQSDDSDDIIVSPTRPPRRKDSK
ncbi:IQ domain-containing protein E isoform X2 [Bombina bombina]|uniref:IQ domain-containing protein E isoform X2 n=1 Tax=Bombina bombina TaxID=8345 RepID=UPI00235ADC51|nr:IQ domain-containing protein E isoform X2 [Bombina bombina]